MLRTDTIQITPEMLALIAKIDEFKGAWRALGTLAPERLSALRRVATIESIGSSTRIEGSKLTDREVEQLLANLEIKRFDTRDEQEVAGYAEVMDVVFSAWQDIPFTENYIKQLHQILLQHSDKDTWHRGQYKTNTNSVAAFNEHGEHRYTLKRVKEHCHKHPADWWEHHGKKDKWHDIIMMEMEQLKHKREHPESEF